MNVLFLLFFISSSAFSLNIGVVDSNYIYTHYDRYIKIDKKLENRRLELNTKINTLKESLLKEENSIRLKNKINKEDEKKLITLNTNIEKKIDEYKDLYYSEQQQYIYDIQLEISSASALIGHNKKYDIILEKTSIPYGGEDISDDIITFLKTKNSYKLNIKNILKNNK